MRAVAPSFVSRLLCWSFATLACVAIPTTASADDDSRTGFVRKVFRDADGGEHDYQVFVPQDYTPARKWPVVLFLHGAGERGSDGIKPTTVGLGPYVRSRERDFPYVVVFPQASAPKVRLLEAWAPESPDGRRALAILEAVESEYAIDTERRILTGWSMGGYGSWQLAAADPEHWHAVVPVSSGGESASAEKLSEVPVWAFHGENDALVPPERGTAMIAALREAGGRPRWSLVPRAGHDVWRTAYARPELWTWLNEPVAGEPNDVARTIEPDPSIDVSRRFDAAFVPEVDVSRCIALRAGTDVLTTLSYAIPGLVPADALSGRIDDIRDRTRAEGRTFSVRFTNISYAAGVERTLVSTRDDGTVAVQIGLRNAELTIGRTYVQGDGRSAVAGRIRIVVGNRRPAWLTVAVRPRIENRRVKLDLVSSDFTIERGNWSVRSPAGVSTKGLGMTRERVSRGLVSGLYGQRSRIEREVESIVPALVANLEEALDVEPTGDLLAPFWPLPVYQPRTRLWPEDMSVDANGLSVVLGMSVAAVDEANVPDQPRRVGPLGPSASELPVGKGLFVGVAPGFLKSLSETLTKADVAHVHVLDVPEASFARYVERDFIESVVPEAKRFGPDAEFWAELVLADPLSLVDVPAPATQPASVETADDDGEAVTDEAAESTTEDAVEEGADAGERAETEPPPRLFALDAPKLRIAISVKPDPETEDYVPFANLDYALVQRAGVRDLQPDFVTRGVEVFWSGKPDVKTTVTFAESYEARDETVNPKPADELFRNAWTSFTESSDAVETTVPDLELGSARLRLTEATWDAPLLSLEFGVPGVRIENGSEESLSYEVKGPNSGWGGPYELPPGEHHQFGVSYDMRYRDRVTGRPREFTLPAGSHAVYRVDEDGVKRLVLARQAGF